ncbi:MAG TPA: biotin/lipoyl-containing protein, partial [Candidatus Binatus sp.]|nr:biotin/lipoyl-containing protein [Candidatus Binatus sp.]
MPTDIIMPQMGESIVEGTITKWLKKPGDKVQRDEPLFEISTDKVDAEIPAPASGVLQEIKVTEGTTVNVNTVVGTIAVDGEAAAKPAAPAPEKSPEAKTSSAGVPPAVAGASRPRTPDPAPPPPPAPAAHEEDEEARSSPLVRKIAREHGISLSQVSGTGLGGRITKQDITSFIESQSSAPTAPAPAASAPPAPASRPASPPAPAAFPGDLVPLTNMRKIIAQRMIESRRTSAHVHCMYEVDFTRIVNLRAKHKAGFEQRHGARLTFMPFFV